MKTKNDLGHITAIYATLDTNEELLVLNDRVRSMRLSLNLPSSMKYYVDWEQTGKNAQSLLEDINAGFVECFICRNLKELTSRFKSFDNLIKNLEFLIHSNIHFIELSTNTKSKTSTGDFSLMVLKSYQEYRAGLKSRGVKLGMRKASKEGKKMGRPMKRDTQLIRKLREDGFTIDKIAKLVGIAVTS